MENNYNTLHLELTSKCNLLCPQCARVFNGKTLENLPQNEISIKTIKNFFYECTQNNLNISNIHVCGNYGDALAYLQLMELVSFFNQNSMISNYVFYTNGSIQNEDYWETLGSLTNSKGSIIFSIDGLSDTNHLYRKGANWDSIIRNAKGFIAKGGKAIWEMLVFEHNEHQIEEVTKLSRDLGFSSFRLKFPDRFNSFSQMTEIQPSKLSPSINKVDEVKCKYQDTGWLYLSFEGELFPCCWLGSQKYKSSKIVSPDLENMYKLHGENFLMLEKNNLKTILNNSLFKEYLQKNLNTKTLEICKKKCQTDQHLKNKYNIIY